MTISARLIALNCKRLRERLTRDKATDAYYEQQARARVLVTCSHWSGLALARDIDGASNFWRWLETVGCDPDTTLARIAVEFMAVVPAYAEIADPRARWRAFRQRLKRNAQSCYEYAEYDGLWAWHRLFSDN